MKLACRIKQIFLCNCRSECSATELSADLKLSYIYCYLNLHWKMSKPHRKIRTYSWKHIMLQGKTEIRGDKERSEGEKERKRSGRDEDTVSLTLKQQPINHRAWRCSEAMHGLFHCAKLSGCQFLPTPPKKLPRASSSSSLSPYLVMSHCIFQYILPQTCGDAGGEGGGVTDARVARRLALTNELSA